MLHRRVAIAAALVLSLLVGPAIAPATAQEAPPGGEGGRQGTPLSTTPLTPSETIEGYKSLSSRGAESDPELLARKDAARVPVVIKFDYDAHRQLPPAASPALPATSPSVTGQRRSRGAPPRAAPTPCTSRAREADVRRGDLQAAVPTAAIGQPPPRGLRRRRRHRPGQPGRRPARGRRRRRRPVRRASEQLQTDSSTEFIGAPPIWDAARRPGDSPVQACIFGILDTGVWPEHPSFADNADLAARPRRQPTGAPSVRLRRQPAHAGHRRVRVQRQADRRPAVPRHLQRRRSAARSTPTPPATATATAPTPPPPRPATSSTSAPIFGIDRGPISRHRARRRGSSTYKVCGLDGLLRVRLGRRRRAGHPRRRRRHQLLDLRRHQPVHRPGRAGLPRRLRGRRLRGRRSAGNDGPGRGDRRTTCRPGSPPSPRRPRPASSRPTLTVTAGDGDTLDARRRLDHAPASRRRCPVVLADDVPGYSDVLLRRRRPRPGSSPARSSPASAARRPRAAGLQRPPGRRRRR